MTSFVARPGGVIFARHGRWLTIEELGLAVGVTLTHVGTFEALRRPVRVGDVMLGVGASVDVAMGIQPLIPSVLIQRADEALLDAKNAGKNTVKAAA